MISTKQLQEETKIADTKHTKVPVATVTRDSLPFKPALTKARSLLPNELMSGVSARFKSPEKPKEEIKVQRIQAATEDAVKEAMVQEYGEEEEMYMDIQEGGEGKGNLKIKLRAISESEEGKKANGEAQQKKQNKSTYRQFSPIARKPTMGRRKSQVDGIPRDQKLILKMLLRPQNFGTGLFDYSCHGNNWIISDEVLGRQSPIDIQQKEVTEYEPKFNVEFKWKQFEALTGLENMEWTLRLKGKNMGGIKLTDLNGRGPFGYKVNHMHMHGPSEHRLEGVQYDLEIHIVHELVKGPLDEPISNYKESLAVVAFLFKIDKESHPFIKKLRPHDFGHITKISFEELLPHSQEELAQSEKALASLDHHQQIDAPCVQPTFYHYKGSLTNPPCADVVNWIVHTEVLPISESDLHDLRNVWHTKLGFFNYRDCQPLCGRKVVRNFTQQQHQIAHPEIYENDDEFDFEDGEHPHGEICDHMH